MLDLLIRGAQVVTPAGVGHWDIGAKEGKIVLIGLPGALPAEAKTIIDATGRIAVPGGVEAHVHIGMPNQTPNWGAINAGPEEHSKAAIWGGTTTIVDFAPAIGPEGADAVQMVRDHVGYFQGRIYTDYSAHCSYARHVTSSAISQIGDLISAGFPSIKVYTTNGAPPTPSRAGFMTDFGAIIPIMEQVAKHGGILAVHAEDDDIVKHNYEVAQDLEAMEWRNMPLIRSKLSEDLSVRRIVRMAQHTGAATYIVHVSASEGVDAISEARQIGLPIYGETILLYASFSSEDYNESDGQKYHTYPSQKYEADRLRLWDGLLNGDLAILATDSIITDHAGKTRGQTIIDVQGGNIGIEVRMGVAYTEGVVRQGMSLERYAAITSTNPARLLGFYPRKGAIAAGSDADISIIDPTVHKRLPLKDLHVGDYNPWEGWDITGWPTTVILRGKVMVDGGEFYGELTDGQLIPRKIDSAVLAQSIL